MVNMPWVNFVSCLFSFANTCRLTSCVDELLHDIGHTFRLVGNEVEQIILALDLIGAGSAHAVVRLGDDRITYLLDKGAAAP